MLSLDLVTDESRPDGEGQAAIEHLAQATRTLRLLNFRLVQLRHTNDQLLAALQDLVAQATAMADGDGQPPSAER